MTAREDLASKIVDRKDTPIQILNCFSSTFKQLHEHEGTVNRLAARKYSQNLGPNLISVLKACAGEISKIHSIEWTECFIQILTRGIDMLSKISQHVFEKPNEYYKFAFTAAAKLSEKAKWKPSLDICNSLLKEIPDSEQDKEIRFLKIQLLISSSNSILQLPISSIKSLEQVYDNLVIKSKTILYSFSSDSLTPKEHSTLNSIYHNLLKLLYNSARLLDIKASGDLNLHKQAMIIRTQGLEFFSKTRPLNKQDFFSFANSSVVTAYKVFSGCSKEYMHDVIDNIHALLQFVNLKDTNILSDSNARNIVEVLIYFCCKLELYEVAKDTIKILTENTEPSDLRSIIQHIKYYLDILRYSLQGNIPSVMEVEMLLHYLSFIFTENGCPTAIESSQLTEIEDWSQKVRKNIEGLIGYLGNSNTVSGIKNPTKLSVENILVIMEIIAYYPKVLKLIDTLNGKYNPDLEIFNYVSGLSYTILYAHTKEEKCSTNSLVHFKKLISLSGSKYIEKMHNICLSLLHIGENDFGIKLLNIILESLQFSADSINSVHLSLFELALKYCLEAKNFFVHNCTLILNYILSQINLSKDSLSSSSLLLKGLDIYHRLHQGYISICISKGVDLSALQSVQYLISHTIYTSISYSGIDTEVFYERELTNLHRSMLMSIKNECCEAVIYNVEMIQELVYIVMSQVYSTDTTRYAEWVVKYLEIVSTAEKHFENEWLMENYMPKAGMKLGVKVQNMIGTVTSSSCNLTLDRLKMSMYLDQMRETEQDTLQIWPSRTQIQHYTDIVHHIAHILQDIAIILKVENSAVSGKYEKIICNESMSISEKLLRSLVKNCISVANITHAFKLYCYETRSLEILLFLLKKMPNDSYKNLRKAIITHRLVLSLWNLGCVEQAVNIYQKASRYSVVIDDEGNYNTLLSNLWILIYRAEFAMEQGKSYESMSLCNEASKILPSVKACNMKRVYLARSRCLYILSKVHYYQGTMNTSYEMLKEARVLINELNLSTISLQNFGVLSMISEDYTTFLRENLISDDRNLLYECIFYPYSSICLQAHSLDMLHHMSEIIKYRGLIPTSNYCLSQGIKVTLILGFLPHFFQFKLSYIQNSMQSYTASELTNENISQDSKDSCDVSGYLIHMGSSLLPFLASCSRSRDSSLDTVHSLDEKFLSCKDIEHICEYIDPKLIIPTLIVMGDIQLSNTTEPTDALQFNYYKLAKLCLMPILQSNDYKRIRSLLQSKLANLANIHNTDAKNCLLQAVRSLGCCEKFPNMFVKSARCCSDFEINSVNISRLCESLIDLSEMLISKSDLKTGYSILSQISSMAGAILPYHKSRIHHLLARNKDLNSWERAFHVFNSIGVSYTRQYEAKTKAVFLPLSDLSEFMSFTQQLPYSIVGISLSDVNYRECIIISRIDPGLTPVNLIISDGCECNTYNRNLRDLISEFAYIMRETASTTSDSKVIKRSSSSWWSRRERLDEMLQNWLQEFCEHYLGTYGSVLCGVDKNVIEVDKIVKDIGSNKKCTKCGQEWNEEAIKMIVCAYVNEKITQDRFKMSLGMIGVTKNLDNILKKIRAFKKQSSTDYNSVVLILDGLLLNIPWESLPILKPLQATRLPSLSFLKTRRCSPTINSSQTFFILNPSKDLENTQQTFHSFLSSRNYLGLDQEPPTESQFKSALEEKDLLLYFGHSSGEQYLKGDKIKDLKIKAVTMLMGCSSGLLKQQGMFDPLGIAIQYMLGGCPALVANLWDVTDKDIDRFSIDMLKRFVDNGESLPNSLQNARKACKLKSLIGAAPVCYGVPVYVSK